MRQDEYKQQLHRHAKCRNAWGTFSSEQVIAIVSLQSATLCVCYFDHAMHSGLFGQYWFIPIVLMTLPVRVHFHSQMYPGMDNKSFGYHVHGTL